MKNFDLQRSFRRLVNEYSNDSIDFSPTGLGMECLDYVQDMKRHVLSSARIPQEEKMQMEKDFKVLEVKLNQLIQGVDSAD
jgi:hypothetical protein